MKIILWNKPLEIGLCNKAISNPTRKGDGTHWSHWIGDKTSEAARFAYVASSRPKYVLVWCVKKLKPLEKTELESLGFEILDIK